MTDPQSPDPGAAQPARSQETVTPVAPSDMWQPPELAPEESTPSTTEDDLAVTQVLPPGEDLEQALTEDNGQAPPSEWLPGSMSIVSAEADAQPEPEPEAASEPEPEAVSVPEPQAVPEPEPETAPQGQPPSRQQFLALQAYCQEVCAPGRTDRAVADALAGIGWDASTEELLRATRTAAAAHAPMPSGAARLRQRLRASMSGEHQHDCRLTPTRLARRANNELDPARQRALEAHLGKCEACREAEARAGRGEEIFAAAIAGATIAEAPAAIDQPEPEPAREPEQNCRPHRSPNPNCNRTGTRTRTAGRTGTRTRARTSARTRTRANRGFAIRPARRRHGSRGPGSRGACAKANRTHQPPRPCPRRGLTRAAGGCSRCGRGAQLGWQLASAESGRLDDAGADNPCHNPDAPSPQACSASPRAAKAKAQAQAKAGGTGIVRAGSGRADANLPHHSVPQRDGNPSPVLASPQLRWRWLVGWGRLVRWRRLVWRLVAQRRLAGKSPARWCKPAGNRQTLAASIEPKGSAEASTRPGGVRRTNFRPRAVSRPSIAAASAGRYRPASLRRSGTCQTRCRRSRRTRALGSYRS